MKNKLFSDNARFRLDNTSRANCADESRRVAVGTFDLRSDRAKNEEEKWLFYGEGDGDV